jgi:hypothetical protein
MDERADLVRMDQRRAYEGYREAELGREKFIFGREFPAEVTHSNLSVIGIDHSVYYSTPKRSLLGVFART